MGSYEPYLPAEGVARVAAPVRLVWHPVDGAARYELHLIPEFASGTPPDDIAAMLSEPRWTGEMESGQWGVTLTALADNGEELAFLFGEPSIVVGRLRE